MTPAQALLARADALLLDFDGPIAALMPPPANAEAATRARVELAGLRLPAEIQSTTDHLAVLRYAAEHHPDRVRALEAICTAAEANAARTCKPSKHARGLLEFAEARDIPVAVVSNNADAAVREFFVRHGWSHHPRAYACRTPETIDWLKPSPRLLQLAADVMRIDLTRAVFIGDAVSDVFAGRAVGVPVIGLAKHDQRRSELLHAGAADVVNLDDSDALIRPDATG